MIQNIIFTTTNIINELNSQFIQLFKLADNYKYDGIEPGDRHGIISLRGMNPDSAFQSGSRVRGGMQLLELSFDLLLTIGCQERLEAEATAFNEFFHLHSGFPALKKTMQSNNLLYDLFTDEQFSCIKRQAIKPPHNWIVDISCGVTAKIAYQVDIDGTANLK